MGAETPIDDAGSGELELAELGKKLQAVQLETGVQAVQLETEVTEAQDGETVTETASSNWQPLRAPNPKHSQVPSLVSMGTVGHPVSCGTPCRYVKRKGGCRDGSACLNCHLCFWVRHQEEQQVARRAQANKKPISSLGTVDVQQAAAAGGVIAAHPEPWEPCRLPECRRAQPPQAIRLRAIRLPAIRLPAIRPRAIRAKRAPPHSAGGLLAPTLEGSRRARRFRPLGRVMPSGSSQLAPLVIR